MNATVAKCNCQHCGQEIEFNPDDANQMAPCPYCGTDTILFIPAPSPRPAAPIPKTYAKTPRFLESVGDLFKEGWEAIGRLISDITHAVVLLMAIGIFFTGVALVFSGCSAEQDEVKRMSSSAIRQNVYVVQYCTGFILIGLSPIIFAAERFVAWLKEHGEKPQNIKMP